MNPFLIAAEYFAWQYSYGIIEFLRAWANIHWFLFYFFSFPMLLRTMFQPLFRLKEDYGRHFDLQKVAEAITVNIIMRITGFITRIALLLVGAVVEAVVFILTFVIFIMYLVAPIGIPIILWQVFL